MAPRSAEAPAASKPAAAGAKKAAAAAAPKGAAAAGANWVPADIVELHDEDVPYCGMLYNGSILGDALKDRPLLARLDWIHVPLLTVTPLLALYGIATVPLRWQTAVWSVVYYFLTGLGITAGACRRRRVQTRRDRVNPRPRPPRTPAPVPALALQATTACLRTARTNRPRGTR